MTSNWRDSMKAQLEPSLVCRCGLRNSPHVRNIRIIDAHGHAVCSCGATGVIQDFQEE